VSSGVLPAELCADEERPDVLLASCFLSPLWSAAADRSLGDTATLSVCDDADRRLADFWPGSLFVKALVDGVSSSWPDRVTSFFCRGVDSVVLTVRFVEVFCGAIESVAAA